ncbi:group II intron maturase-specific domain-containing protein [Streptomyces sp. NPDC059631]|uniref:group II intron maturase-specific domain-containing protein n=1 Tax=unclassified Streptomyces TaxID=2593676 RepID=UPI0036CB9BD5
MSTGTASTGPKPGTRSHSPFDFLGFNIRRHGDSLIITPSRDAVKRVRNRLRSEMQALLGQSITVVLRRLSPIVRGWSAYHRTVVSSRTFSALDSYVWKLTYKWAKRTHPKKSKHWIVNKYFGRLNRSKMNNWVFGDRVTGAHLPKFAWTDIRRHQMVRVSRHLTTPHSSTTGANAVRRAHHHRWMRLHKHHFTYRRHGGSDESKNLRLVHSECHRLHHAGDSDRK